MGTITMKNWAKIEEQPPLDNIRIINTSANAELGQGSFTLEVMNQPFVGYAIGVIDNSSVNTAQKVSSIQLDLPSATPESLVLSPKVLSNEPIGTSNTVSVAVNIPIGIYPGGTIDITTVADISEDVHCSSSVGFSLTDDYMASIATFSVPFDRAGTPV